jgi:hypothetical protein
MKNLLSILIFFVLLFIASNSYSQNSIISQNTIDEMRGAGVILAIIDKNKSLCILNTLKYDEGPMSTWFVLYGDNYNRHLKSPEPCLVPVQEILISPSRKYLAVESYRTGICMVEIVSLPPLLNDKEYQVLQSISPFPVGCVSIARWEKEKNLVLKSGALLNHSKNGEIPGFLYIDQEEEFLLNMENGSIIPLGPHGKDPVSYFLKKLKSERIDRFGIVQALIFLKGPEMMSKLNTKAKETNDENLMNIVLEIKTKQNGINNN